MGVSEKVSQRQQTTHINDRLKFYVNLYRSMCACHWRVVPERRASGQKRIRRIITSKKKNWEFITRRLK